MTTRISERNNHINPQFLFYYDEQNLYIDVLVSFSNFLATFRELRKQESDLDFLVLRKAFLFRNSSVLELAMAAS